MDRETTAPARHRIITLQRQAVELGRLRTGWSVPHRDPKKRPVPVKSKTWVLTSHNKTYIDAAAELWGGEAHRWQPQGSGDPQWRVITQASSIPAMLPNGEPLRQYNELWSGGGCARRCDGQTEMLSKKPCLCLDEYGEDWYLMSPKEVCRATSRLSVMMPDLPGIGLWRAETHSFYAANEWPGVLDLVVAGTGGRGFVPVQMRIEPRTRVARGQTKHFPVVVCEFGNATIRQAITGTIPNPILTAPPQQRPALEAAVSPYLADALVADTADEVLAIYRLAEAAGDLNDDLKARLKAIGTQLRTAEKADATADKAKADGEEEPIDAEIVEDSDPAATDDLNSLWQQILTAAGSRNWTTSQVAQRFAADNNGLDLRQANAGQLRRFLTRLREPIPA
ncbi:hypothetical protein ACFY4B_27010 [Kitasatospora sp. NPDC001261]|uniref:recombination directionality factor n=1 Tax=Kitasatospora sp. NPDC001261 TaxID=3364012 RepID=UPI0036A39A72